MLRRFNLADTGTYKFGLNSRAPAGEKGFHFEDTFSVAGTYASEIEKAKAAMVCAAMLAVAWTLLSAAVAQGDASGIEACLQTIDIVHSALVDYPDATDCEEAFSLLSECVAWARTCVPLRECVPGSAYASLLLFELGLSALEELKGRGVSLEYLERCIADLKGKKPPPMHRTDADKVCRPHAPLSPRAHSARLCSSFSSATWV